MKRILTFLVLVLAITIFAEPVIKEKSVRGYKFFDGEKQISESELNGEVLEYYTKERKNLKGKYNYSDGKLNGTQEEYYIDGKLHFEYNLINGMKDGIGKEYDQNGVLVYERNLKDGNGLGYEYYPAEEKIIRRIRKYENGKMVAISKPNYDLEGKPFERDEVSLFLEARGYIEDQWFYHAVKTFEDYHKKYNKSSKAPEAYFLIGYTYNNHIKDYDKAKEYYENFLKQYPDHQLASSAKFELDTIGKPIEEVTNFSQ